MKRHLKRFWREWLATSLVVVGGLSVDLVDRFAGGFIAGFGACWLLSLWADGA